MSDFKTFDFETFEKDNGNKKELVDYLKNTYDLGFDFDEAQNKLKDFNTQNNTNFELYDIIKAKGNELNFRKKSVQNTSQNEALQNAENPQMNEAEKAYLEQKEALKQKELKRLELLKENEKDYLNESENIFLQTGKEALSSVGLSSENWNKATIAGDELLGNLSHEEAENERNRFIRENLFKEYDKSINEKINQGKGYEDLSEGEKKYLRNNAYDRDLINKTRLEAKANGQELNSTQVGFYLRQKELSLQNKENYELDNLEREIVKDNLGILNYTYNSLVKDDNDKTNLEEYKENFKAKNEISDEVRESVNLLRQIHSSNNLLNLVKNSNEENAESRQDYIKALNNVAQKEGFSGGAGLDDKGEVYFFKEDENGKEQAYKVNTGFFDNLLGLAWDTKGEIAGGIAGAWQGAKQSLTKGKPNATGGDFKINRRGSNRCSCWSEWRLYFSKYEVRTRGKF